MSTSLTPKDILMRAEPDLLEEIIKDQMQTTVFANCEDCHRVVHRILDFNDVLDNRQSSIDTLALFYEHFEHFKPYDGIFDAKSRKIYCPTCLMKKTGTELYDNTHDFIHNQCYRCAHKDNFRYTSSKLPHTSVALCDHFNKSCARCGLQFIQNGQRTCEFFKRNPVLG